MEAANRIMAVERLLKEFPELIEAIWLKRGSKVNTELLVSPNLSSDQYLLVAAALNIWNADIVTVDLEAMINGLDDENFTAFIAALLLARGRIAKPGANFIAVDNA